jgi:hypothetical protein
MTLDQTSAADATILAIVRTHPEGITVSGLMREHKLVNRDTVLDSINRLEEQRKIRVVRTQVSTGDHYDGIMVYPL